MRESRPMVMSDGNGMGAVMAMEWVSYKDVEMLRC